MKFDDRYVRRHALRTTGNLMKIVAVATLLSTTLLVACGKSDGGGAAPAPTGTVAHVPSPTTCLRTSTVYPGSGSWDLYRTSGFQPMRSMGWNSPGQSGFGASFGLWFGVNPYAHYGYPGYGYGNPWPYGTPYGSNIGGSNIGGSYGGGSFGGGFGSGAISGCACPYGSVPACDTTGLTCVSENDLRAVGHNIAMYNYNGSNAFVFDQYHGYGGWYPSSNSCRIAQACVVGTASCGYGTCRALRPGGTVGICSQ